MTRDGTDEGVRVRGKEDARGRLGTVRDLKRTQVGAVGFGEVVVQV